MPGTEGGSLSSKKHLGVQGFFGGPAEYRHKSVFSPLEQLDLTSKPLIFLTEESCEMKNCV